MDRTLEYNIHPPYVGIRLGDFLSANGYSRHIRTYIKQHPGSLLRNGHSAFFYEILEVNDHIIVALKEEESSKHIPPVPLPIHIIYEDEDLMIMNKPSNMPIHPSIGNYENTLANGIAWYFAAQGKPFIYRCINRLDRDTSGLLIIAKNMLSGAILSEQMKNREIHRTYLALVEGCTEPFGLVDAPIGRTEESIITRQVDYKNGAPARTHFKQLAYQPATPEILSLYPAFPPQGISLVQLRLETGRTHQIRVHMTSIGHPLCGDTLYNPTTKIMKRQALHSYSLEFIHPITKKPLRFTSSLPEDMKTFLTWHESLELPQYEDIY